MLKNEPKDPFCKVCCSPKMKAISMGGEWSVGLKKEIELKHEAIWMLGRGWLEK